MERSGLDTATAPIGVPDAPCHDGALFFPDCVSPVPRTNPLITVANGRALFRRARISLVELAIEMEEFAQAVRGARYGRGDQPENELGEVQAGANMVAEELRQILAILRSLDTIDLPLFEADPTEEIRLSDDEREQLEQAARRQMD